MDWFKKHVDTAVVIGSILTCMVWMNGRFADVDKELSAIKTEIAVMKTVLIMKNIYPVELLTKVDNKND